MRKMRVALVILLLLAFVATSYAGSAVSTKSFGDTLSKSKASLTDIKKKMAIGNSEIARQNQLMSAYTKYMAKQTMGNVSKNIATGKNQTKASIRPPTTTGMTVPTAGIGDAIKALGSIDMSIVSPISLAKNIRMPALAIMK